SWRDIVLAAGGMFLLYKGTREIHQALEGEAKGEAEHARQRESLAGVAAQIMVVDIGFSLDSVIHAVGMSSRLWLVATALATALAIVQVASKPLRVFVQRYPTVKLLPLSFLILIGMTLIADGAGFHVPKGYIYAATGFSVGVEALNQFASRRRGARRSVA